MLLFDKLEIMSSSTVQKASAIIIGLLLLAISAYPVFAQVPLKATPPVNRFKTVGPASGPGVVRKPFIQEKIEDLKEKMASKTAVLKAKLAAFKDKRKAEIAERINTALNRINQIQTTQMQNHLNRMSLILNKLEARVNEGKPDIKDPTAAKTAITSARSVIATASAAVSAQAQKDYTIQVTSETKVKIDTKLQRDKLHADLLSVRKSVIDAKQAVANAIRIAKAGPSASQSAANSKIKKEGTASGER